MLLTVGLAEQNQTHASVPLLVHTSPQMFHSRDRRAAPAKLRQPKQNGRATWSTYSIFDVCVQCVFDVGAQNTKYSIFNARAGPEPDDASTRPACDAALAFAGRAQLQSHHKYSSH